MFEGDGMATAVGKTGEGYTCRFHGYLTDPSWSSLTRDDLNREGSCSKLARRRVHCSELCADKKYGFKACSRQTMMLHFTLAQVT